MPPPIQSLAASTGSSAANHSVGADTAQSASTTYDDNVVISDNGVTTSNTDVYITVDDSGIKVGVPTTIILGGVPDATGTYAGKNTGHYSVSVEGDIAGTEKLVVEPDDTSVTLSQTGNTNTPTATITQEQTEFNFQNLWDEDVVTGVVASQEPLTAGKWHGSFNFNISVGIDYGRAIQSWDISATSNDDVTMTYYQPNEPESNDPVSGFANLTSSLLNLFRPITAMADEVETYEDGTVVITGTGNMKTNVNSVFYDIEAEQAYVDSLLADYNGQDSTYLNSRAPGKIKVTSHLKYTNNGAWSSSYMGLSTALTALQNYVASSGENFVLFMPKNIVIQDGVTNISQSAFTGCSEIESIELPNSISIIGQNAFLNCTSLTGVSLPASITKIDNYAFKGCTSLSTLNISRNATFRLNSDCFTDTNLTFVDFKNSNIRGSLGKKVDVNFDSLSNVSAISGFSNNWIDNNMTLYINKVPVTGQLTIPEGCTYSLDLSKYSKITSVVIPDSATGSYQFDNCPNITNVTLGANCRYRFYNCTSLANITFSENATAIGSGFTGCFSNCSSLTNLTIPNGVLTIGEEMFQNSTNLTNVNIPNSVTTISRNAFYGCSGLTNINIPNGVTSIGNYAFKDCTGLEEIVLPESLTTIGGNVFNGCTSLIDIYVPSSVTNVVYRAFYGLPANSTIYCETQDVADLVTSSDYDSSKTTVVVDATQFS